MTSQQCQALLRTLEADLQAGALVDTPLTWADVYARAETLSADHTEQLGTRGSDVRHTVVDGEVLVRDFRPVRVDPAEAAADARAEAAALLARAGI